MCLPAERERRAAATGRQRRTLGEAAAHHGVSGHLAGRADKDADGARARPGGRGKEVPGDGARLLGQRGGREGAERGEQRAPERALLQAQRGHARRWWREDEARGKARHGKAPQDAAALLPGAVAAPRLLPTTMSAAQLGTAIPGAGTKGRPVVFFDVAIGDQPAGRIKMELYSDSVPK